MLHGLRSLEEDFPITSSYPNSTFWVAPYPGAPWIDHDSDTGAVVGSSGGSSLVSASASDPAAGTAIITGRTPAVFSVGFVTPWGRTDAQEWHDTDTGVTVASGFVSSWADRALSGDVNRALTQSSAGSRPVWLTPDPDFKNLGSIGADGVDDFLASGPIGGANADWSGAPIAQPTTHYIVGRIDKDTTATNGNYYFDGPLSATSRQAFIDISTAQVYAGAQFGGYAMPRGTVFIICVIYNGASSTVYVNDPVTPVESGDAGTQGISGRTLFARFSHGAGECIPMRVAAVGSFAAAETLANRTLMMAFLKAKYDPGLFDSTSRLLQQGWWRSSYTAPSADPRWVGTPNKGGSGGLLVQDADADAVPTIGSTIGNGLSAAQFATNKALETVDAATSLISSTNGSIVVLANVASASPHINPFFDPGIVCDRNSSISMAFSASGLEAHINDGVSNKRAFTACTTVAWHLLVVRWTTSQIQCSVDGVNWATTATSGGVTGLSTSKIVIGKQPGIAFCPMEVAEVRLMQTTISDADVMNIKREINARYNFAL